MCGVEAEIEGLIVGREGVESLLYVRMEVVGNFDDKQRGVGQDPCTALDICGGETTVSFARNGVDGVVWIFRCFWRLHLASRCYRLLFSLDVDGHAASVGAALGSDEFVGSSCIEWIR